MERKPDTQSSSEISISFPASGKKIGRTRNLLWPLSYGVLVLLLLYCFGQLEKTAEGLSIDSFPLEDVNRTPVLHISPSMPPFRGEVLLLPKPGQSKETYSFFAETLALEGFRVFCLDLPGTGNSSQSFSFSRMPAFLESAYTALLVRNLIIHGHTAIVAFDRSGEMAQRFLTDHPEIRLTVLVADPPSSHAASNTLSTRIRLQNPLPGGINLLPFVPAQEAVQEQLRNAFPPEEKSIPPKRSSRRTWWSLVLFFTVLSFPFFLKTILMFRPPAQDTIPWNPISLKAFFTDWLWVLLLLGLAGLYHFQSLQPIGYISLGTLLVLLLFLPPSHRITPWRWEIPQLSSFLPPIACFLYLYWLIGTTAVQGGIQLSIAADRWIAFLSAFCMALPFTAFYEIGMKRLRGSCRLSLRLPISVGLYVAATAVWYLSGYSPLLHDSPLTLSFLGFSTWGLLLTAVLLLAWFTTLLREWSGNLVSTLLFHTLCLSWLFTSLSIRIS